MLKLYYSGPRSYLAIQQKPNYSLGGYVSSSIVPNNQNGSLFSEISAFTKQSETIEVIGLILKNDGIEDINNIQFYFNFPDGVIGQYQIAAVALSKNSKDEYMMEEVSNSQSLPYYAEFYDANGIANKVNLGDLEAGAMIGLWFKRQVNFNINVDDNLWNDYLNQVQKVNKESIGLIFDWIDEESSSSLF
jgi:hypothetical protein